MDFLLSMDPKTSGVTESCPAMKPEKTLGPSYPLLLYNQQYYVLIATVYETVKLVIKIF